LAGPVGGLLERGKVAAAAQAVRRVHIIKWAPLAFPQ